MKKMEPVTLVARLGGEIGLGEFDIADIEPGDVPIVDQSGRVIGRAKVDGDGLVWARTDGATAERVSVGCGPVSIGGKAP